MPTLALRLRSRHKAPSDEGAGILPMVGNMAGGEISVASPSGLPLATHLPHQREAYPAG